MEGSETISFRKFQELDTEQKQEIYESLLDLEKAIDGVPKKSLRKTLELCLFVLRYKGDQAAKFQNQLEEKTKTDDSAAHLADENEKLKHLIQKCEQEKSILQTKIKEMNKDMLNLQRRLQESAEGSDKDSSDPLSELDRKEEFLKNINSKNKHIKRLLREIESLQMQNIEQSKTIIVLEKQVHQLQDQTNQLNADINYIESERKAFEERIKVMDSEIARLEENLAFLEEDRNKNEKNLKEFISKLEHKIKHFRNMLNEKNLELKQLRSKFEENSSISDYDLLSQSGSKEKETADSHIEESLTLLRAIEERDNVIQELESKIKTMAEEMVVSTKLMNKISSDHKNENKENGGRIQLCCETTKKAFQNANERCEELSEMLEQLEEDNRLKAGQAQEAIATLRAYQQGEDGLVQLLKKCARLEEKLAEREKHIRELVKEINSMQEILNENTLLRQKLNIPEDVIISTRNIVAKERNKEKIIERLKLKLRASEEIRLQLTLEISDLRKQLMDSHQVKGRISGSPLAEKSGISSELSFEKEIGEIDDCIQKDEDNSSTNKKQELLSISPNCVRTPENLNEPIDKTLISEWEEKYIEVVEENENLRNGLQEILEKIRDYDATSDHITIDTDILNRMLDTMNARNSSGWDNPAQRLQSELVSLRERELALREKIHFSERTPLASSSPSSSSSSSSSMDNVREDGEIHDDSFLLELNLAAINEPIDTSTRPTTPNKSIDQSCLPVIMSSSGENLEQNRSLQLKVAELEIYHEKFNQFMSLFDCSDEELKKCCSQMATKLTDLEMKLNAKCKAFDFLTEDFDQTLSEVKQKELKNIDLITELRNELDTKNLELTNLQRKYDSKKDEIAELHSHDDFMKIQKANSRIHAQLAFIVQTIFSGKIPKELEITEECNIYGVINEKLELDIIVADEYEQLRKSARDAANKEMQLQTKCSQLEGLLNIAQDQILSQQRLINEITDNHINLRHLVADLQSTSEDKLLIAKIQRDLDNAKLEISRTKSEIEKVQQTNKCLIIEKEMREKKIVDLSESHRAQCKRNEIKLKFLQKSLLMMREKYFKFTPLIFLADYIIAYTKNVKNSIDIESFSNEINDKISCRIEEIIAAKQIPENIADDSSEILIKLVKSETKTKLFEEQLKSLQEKYETVQNKLKDQMIQWATEEEHWRTIDALFGQNDVDSNIVTKDDDLKSKIDFVEASTSTDLIPLETAGEMIDQSTSPISSPSKKSNKDFINSSTQTSTVMEGSQPQTSSSTTNCETQTETVQVKPVNIQTSPVESLERRANSVKSLENQLQKALQLAETRQELLLNAEKEVSQMKQHIEHIEEANKASKPQTPRESHQQQNEMIEKTILSFYTLLSEKDNSISKYQELLLTERQEFQSNFANQMKNIEKLNETVESLNCYMKNKDKEIFELKSKLEMLSVRRNSGEKLEIAIMPGDVGDNSLNEISDEKVEEMFEGDDVTVPKEKSKQQPNHQVADLVPKKEADKSTDERLLKKIKNLTHKLRSCENVLKVKENEIILLKEKLHLNQEQEKGSGILTANPEIERLQQLLHEKDKHINDLMETLNNFHDDQKQFIADSSNYSADQISKLVADITRTEAANKIYQTQLEALRRQVANLTQREKQTRELNQSLRNQLIKRPVVSIKTELNARIKIENMQKKIQALENEREENRALLKHQQMVIEAKRAKTFTEVGLWDKQKRWQQNAEKFKSKLEDTECSLEKTKSLLQSARNTISRLEKDKHVLEVKLARASGNVGKCCATPSCPDLHHVDGSKYTTSESPDTFTGASSECSSPARGASMRTDRCNQCNLNFCSADNRNCHQSNIIETLKSRIEMQQRKILALEMNCKGSNISATDSELEKLQEKLSAAEAQNIRLEAKILQLQLDNDLLRQDDNGERMEKRVKHLEDYIIALKEELAQAEARTEYSADTGVKTLRSQYQDDAGQTILTLKRIVEKLRVENKYLKDGHRSCESRSTSADSTMELSRLQQMYTESLDRISALQIELNLRAKCNNCGSSAKVEANTKDDIQFIKEQLMKKTQLLQKAKVLLTRAAAKEKLLKEQLALWKRKCSELQNVPVIDEQSE